MKFTDFNFEEKILEGIKKAGFSDCTPVQEKTYVHSLKGKDVYVQSQTGTGKTAAFLLTIFQNFNNPEIKFNKKALIIAPTRELAVQIEKDAKELGRFLNLKTGCFYGGAGYKEQEDLLAKGVDIAIGTPGRLIDFVQKGSLKLMDIGYLVIDEADRLFDMGFFPDIRKIVRKMLPYNKRQTMLFSATMSVSVKQMSWEYMNSPENVEITPEKITVDTVKQSIFHVGKREKISLLLGILNKYIPRNVLIFTNMKSTAVKVHKYLQYNGKKCKFLTGDLPQSKRLSIINDFKKGDLDILIATDVAARGLHVDNLEMIINYDLPGDFENYVHRIGRTARAGNSGRAISLACEDYIFNLESIEKYIGKKIPVEYAGDDLYARVERIPEREFRSMRERRNRVVSGSKSGTKRRNTPPKRDNRQINSRTEKRSKVHPKKRGDEKGFAKSSIPKVKKFNKPKSKKPLTAEERLEYYKKKYGDNFQIKDDSKKKKEPVLKKIFSILRNRRS